ncbi:MAG TPA: septum formation protein Maf [Candidatus Avacidaminococcus intestinavium]|uniref:dTTP/UTP pyrophosphatase n=1 Tax=Candidatus Avacidaminococcus intestinavium TaxID=2840684 RepID=A0A9D1SLI5_9FIRM|nr:septum formation protein Maf [Candidatus Avacidaminococcus intestinavium]
MNFILASASPRRQMLLRQIGIEATIIKPDGFVEKTQIDGSIKALVRFNALGKATFVQQQVSAADVLIAADTIVAFEGKILGKPQNRIKAQEMLECLAGKMHHVITCLVVMYKGQTEVACVTTEVYFRSLTASEIEDYLAAGESMDKAGAYGIQGQGAILVEKINGCYNNVVGLPLTCLYKMLNKLEVK